MKVFENHIYLLSRKVHDFIYDEVFPMLPCIDAEVMFCHANPLWDEWQFTTNANYDLKMVPRGTVQLEHEDEVEVFSGASAINLANKMIRGAESELEELIDYQ